MHRMFRVAPSLLLASVLVVPAAHAAAAGVETPPSVDAKRAVSADAVSDIVEQPMPSSGVADLEAIVVAGRQPGPGLWKVRKGDHVLWILGTQSPLPKRMEWDSAYVDKQVAASEEVLLAPAVTLNADVGFFGGLALLPSMFKARKNPDGKTLSEVVSPAQYARWTVLKQRYIGRDKDIEEWRPLFAALTLYDKAIDRTGMIQDNLASARVAKQAKKHGRIITSPTLKVKIQEPKIALKAFAKISVDDLECFGRTLDRIEGDLGNMVASANAWATGDLETLRALPYNNQLAACNAAISGNEIARRQGLGDIEAKLRAQWLDAAENALAKRGTSFAVLPMRQLLQPNGYLQALIDRGYAVEEP